MEVQLFANALQLAVYVTAPLLGLIVLAGLVSGVLQSVTQVSDESISLGLRIVATVVALYFYSHFMFAELQGFATYVWNIV